MDENMNNDTRMVLRTEGLVKRYGKRTVVNDVSIDVKQGEIVGLLGPNGAGKTTSFYMTTGLIVPNAGHIYLDDLDITKFPVYKRARAGIGYLAQEASVFRKMSVEDNIMSVLEMTGKSHDYQREKLESLIKEFRLQKVRKSKGDTASPLYKQLQEAERIRDFRAKELKNMTTLAGDQRAVEMEELARLEQKAKEIRELHEDWKRAHRDQVSDPTKDPHYLGLVRECRNYIPAMPAGLAVD